MIDIPMEPGEDAITAAKNIEVPASEMKPGKPSKEQMTPEPLPDVHQRTSNNDLIDLYLVKKDLIGAFAKEDMIVAYEGKLKLERVPKHEIILGKGWIRRTSTSSRDAFRNRGCTHNSNLLQSVHIAARR